MSSFAIAKVRLTRDAFAICQRYLRPGTVKGDWWVCSTPWRIDRDPSFGVNLKSGYWKDFGRPDEKGGDIIDLLCRLTDKSALEIVKEICGE